MDGNSTGRTAQKWIDVLGGLARNQYGVVSRRQLLEAGLPPSTVGSYLRNGRLVSLYAGVYAVGHDVLTPRGRWMAAVLVGGPDSALSHRSAAGLWGLVAPVNRLEIVRRSKPGRRRDPPATRSRSIQAHLTIHRSRSLSQNELAVVDRIPVTTVARTLLDLSGDFSRSRLQSALIGAERLGVLNSNELARTVSCGRGRKGVGQLRELAAEWNPERAATRSELEADFLALCERGGFPTPIVNSRLEGFEVDCYWPDSKLVVELDGFAYHRDRQSFERDRHRDAVLQASGLRVLRFTFRMVSERPESIVQTLRGFLARTDAQAQGS